MAVTTEQRPTGVGITEDRRQAEGTGPRRAGGGRGRSRQRNRQDVIRVGSRAPSGFLPAGPPKDGPLPDGARSSRRRAGFPAPGSDIETFGHPGAGPGL